MADWSLIAKGALEDAAGLAEDLGHLFRKHGANVVALSTGQFQGDPRDIPALDADPNAPVEATPAVAEPEDDGPATDEAEPTTVSGAGDLGTSTREPASTLPGTATDETRDDLPLEGTLHTSSDSKTVSDRA